VAPAHDYEAKNLGELHPEEIQKRVDANPELWVKHADELRNVALKVLEVVDARNADGLFQAGTAVDTACENCHLEFYYPGDRAAVEADRNSRVTISQPAK
jgi:hypothetical protein